MRFDDSELRARLESTRAALAALRADLARLRTESRRGEPQAAATATATPNADEPSDDEPSDDEPDDDDRVHPRYVSFRPSSAAVQVTQAPNGRLQASSSDPALSGRRVEVLATTEDGETHELDVVVR